LQDPLAELVKIEPQAIGVGQYQHDMKPARMAEALGGVVEDCVNAVGVDVNTASYSLLSYIAGISTAAAKNIVAYREENGEFTRRAQILKVPKIGAKAFEQCAGFLRVPGSDELFDNTGVHPESYELANRLLSLFGYTEENVRKGEVGMLRSKVALRGVEKVCKELNDTHGIDTTPRAIRGMISATSETGTSLFTIKVSHTDKEYACKVATAIEKVAPPAVTEIAKPQRLTYSTITSYITEVIKEINKQSENGNIDVSDKDIYDIVEQKELGLSTSLECFKSVNSPVVDTSADSPSVTKFALVAAIVAAFAVFAIFVIKGLFRTNVSTEEDLKNLVCRPVLGSVPHWESNKK
jgi:competence ComEA-like helix-hairpin-helix protein